MASVFIKVPVSERLPKEGGSYGVIVSDDFFSQADFYYSIFNDKDEWSRNNITHWIEEIELPTEEELKNNLQKQGTTANYALYQSGYEDCANFILNKLKGGNQ